MNIKHLLQDDALTWYGNAYITGLLTSWEAFKAHIRREFLPSNYAYVLRVEAYHRLQGEEESFAKFYQDISTLFHYVEPPMTEQEKVFIIKKNMNATYASIAASHHSTTTYHLVKACREFDELRKLQNIQRRMPLPHSTLLEPSLGTPVQSQRAGKTPQQQIQRFGKLHLVEASNTNADEAENKRQTTSEQTATSSQDNMIQTIENLTQQVNMLKLRWERKEHERNQQTSPRPNQPEGRTQRTPTLICWNCDEEGHHFMDCPKPQAILFCYRCGQKGFSLRSCYTCRNRTGNESAGIQ